MDRQAGTVRIPHPQSYAALIASALREDLGELGCDLTSDAIISAKSRCTATITARDEGRIAGLPVFDQVFRHIDSDTRVTHAVEDGDWIKTGSAIAELEGPTKSILLAERTALNMLSHLSGVATATSDLVDKVAGTGTRIACTRKTLPGLRVLQKYAVHVGGGMNHRASLSDAVLIKENHIAAAGGVELAISRVKQSVGHMVKVSVEIETLDQLKQALAAGVDVVLLDNMELPQLRECVSLARGKAIVEASGRVRQDNVRAMAETGVDVLSVGWITHSSTALDISLMVSSVE